MVNRALFLYTANVREAVEDSQLEQSKRSAGRPPAAETLVPHMIRLPAATMEEVEEIARREASPVAAVLRRFIMERLEQMRRERSQ